ncbi:MAG: GvpL/GvpF-family gas vesicle protein 1 [Dehalococcoidia bacterium]|nr:GvpL/GvpF-family gas vesicle protein 1 [Dehalococcoidia bacterium]
MTTPTGRYLYCIIRCSEERTFEDAVPIGDQPGPVYTVSQDGLAVVVSDTLARDHETTRANMLAHQRVQERVMKEFTLLPVRFDTVAKGARALEDVRRLLERRSQEFEGLLTEMEGKVELGLKALWRDEHAFFEEIATHEEAIGKLRDSLRGKSPQATHFERIRLGEMVKRALERRRKAKATELLLPLSPIACRTVENPVVVDRMILNAAFLVDGEREGEFDRAVGKLDEEVGERIALRYVGHAPPYNFVNIVVNWEEV